MVYWIYKQNTDTGAKRLQEQLGTILAQGPDPKGASAATHFQTYRAVLGSEHPHVHTLWTHQHKVACGGVWRDPQAGFRKDAVVQTPGSDMLRDSYTRIRPHFPLTVALLLDSLMKQRAGHWLSYETHTWAAPETMYLEKRQMAELGSALAD